MEELKRMLSKHDIRLFSKDGLTDLLTGEEYYFNYMQGWGSVDDADSYTFISGIYKK